VPETPVPPAALTGAVPPGYVLAGRYALVRPIARGGMADVWEAKDTLLERQVAVKILHPHLAADSAFVARFRTEAIAAARLHHRSIVAIFDTCSDGGVEAIVMELARGHTLREEIDRHGALDPVVVINIGVDVADALQSAHAADLIHRDVKPANILLCDDQRVMVTDFGIAKVRDNSDRTQTGTMLGSVKYVSPEQVEGHPVDPRSDVYSLGVVLYEALTGQPPFVADTPAATALARLHSTPTHPGQLRPDAPRALTDLIMKAMSLSPAHRFATAAEMRAALLAIRLDSPRTAGPPPVPDATAVNPTPPTRTNRAASPAPPVRRPPAPPSVRPQTPGRARWGAAVVAAVIIGFALIVAAILLSQANPGLRADGSPSTTEPGASTTAGSDGQGNPGGQTLVGLQADDAFDPGSGDGESDDKVPLAVDGKANTAWVTEWYPGRDFKQNRKTGVGIIVKADNATKLAHLDVKTPGRDWSAQVYVSNRKASDLSGWGEPAGQVTGASGDTQIDLKGGATGQYILLWITVLPSSPLSDGAGGGLPYIMYVNELTATGAAG
jgi:serine/threonine protein kinase